MQFGNYVPAWTDNGTPGANYPRALFRFTEPWSVSVILVTEDLLNRASEHGEHNLDKYEALIMWGGAPLWLAKEIFGLLVPAQFEGNCSLGLGVFQGLSETDVTMLLSQVEDMREAA